MSKLDPIDRDLETKTERFRAALAAFVERLKEDRWILAAVLVGSLERELIWWRESIHLWVIEADDVQRRRKSDGEEPRIFRTLVEDDINIHVELIARTTFKKQVEGASRTAFTHSFFSARELIWSRDESIARWFEDANSLAIKDQRNERMITATWLIWSYRHAVRELELKDDVEMAAGTCVGMAWCLAAMAVVDAGIVYEDNILYWAMERDPELFGVMYRQVIDRHGAREPVEAAVAKAGELIEAHVAEWMAPIVAHMQKHAGRPVPLSELADHWAHSQIYPCHIEAACEQLMRAGEIEKHAMTYKLTKKSRTDVEEPAYIWVGA